MKKEVYFKNIENFGNLYLEHVFCKFEDEPIIFSCVNDENELFICACSEIRHEQRWLVSKCKAETLKELVERKIDIRTALCMNEYLAIATMDLYGNESSRTIRKGLVDSLELPEDGVFLREMG